MFGLHRNRRESDEARPLGKLTRSEAVGGVAIAALAVGSMLIGAPVVARVLPAAADTLKASIPSQESPTAATDRAQKEGGALSTSAKERAESGEYPELTPESEPWIGRPAQNVLVDRAYTSRRVEFPVGKAITLNNEEWAASEAKVTFGWTGTMRVTCNGATAYEDYASAGIAQNALNFDANSSDWQDKAEAIGFGRESYQLVVVGMTFENVDATPQTADLDEFYAAYLACTMSQVPLGTMPRRVISSRGLAATTRFAMSMPKAMVCGRRARSRWTPVRHKTFRWHFGCQSAKSRRCVRARVSLSPALATPLSPKGTPGICIIPLRLFLGVLTYRKASE